MGSRLDNLQENKLTTLMQSISSDIEELKAKQLIGQDNLIVYELQTSGTYDISITVPSGNTGQLTVELTAINQQFFFYHTTIEVWQDSPIAANLLRPFNYSIQSNNIDGTPYRVRQYIYIYNTTGSSHTYYAKFYFKSTEAFGVQLS